MELEPCMFQINLDFKMAQRLYDERRFLLKLAGTTGAQQFLVDPMASFSNLSSYFVVSNFVSAWPYSYNWEIYNFQN